MQFSVNNTNMNSRYTKVQIEWLKENYYSKSTEECCEFLKCSVQALRSLCCKRGIKKKFYVDHSKPINLSLDNPIFIYLLGFIWADGFLKKNGKKYWTKLSVQKDDGVILQKLFQSIGNFKISETLHLLKKDVLHIMSGNAELGEFLYLNDYLIKSYCEPTKILNKIPKNLQYYWWRGFYEGDGSLSLCKRGCFFSISGQYDYLWDCTANLLTNMGIKFFIKRKITKWGKNSTINVYDRINILNIMFYMYKERKFDKIGLFRKYKKFIELLKNRIKIKSKEQKLKDIYNKNIDKWDLNFMPSD